MADSLGCYSKEDLLMMRTQWVLRKHEQNLKALMDSAEFNSYWPRESVAKEILHIARETNRRAWRQVGRELYPRQKTA